MFNLTRKPDSIVDVFVARNVRERDRHIMEIERLQAIIDDATARLVNHRIAADALNAMLMPLCNVQLAEMDLLPSASDLIASQEVWHVRA